MIDEKTPRAEVEAMAERERVKGLVEALERIANLPGPTFNGERVWPEKFVEDYWRMRGALEKIVSLANAFGPRNAMPRSTYLCAVEAGKTLANLATGSEGGKEKP